MVQRLAGIAIGALVTFVVLWLSEVTNQADRLPWYAAAVVIGAIVTAIAPAALGAWFGRRGQEARDGAIEREVQRQLADERARKDD
jgi:hypothetical protein